MRSRSAWRACSATARAPCCRASARRCSWTSWTARTSSCRPPTHTSRVRPALACRTLNEMSGLGTSWSNCLPNYTVRHLRARFLGLRHASILTFMTRSACVPSMQGAEGSLLAGLVAGLASENAALRHQLAMTGHPAPPPFAPPSAVPCTPGSLPVHQPPPYAPWQYPGVPYMRATPKVWWACSC